MAPIQHCLYPWVLKKPRPVHSWWLSDDPLIQLAFAIRPRVGSYKSWWLTDKDKKEDPSVFTTKNRRFIPINHPIFHGKSPAMGRCLNWLWEIMASSTENLICENSTCVQWEIHIGNPPHFWWLFSCYLNVFCNWWRKWTAGSPKKLHPKNRCQILSVWRTIPGGGSFLGSTMSCTMGSLTQVDQAHHFNGPSLELTTSIWNWAVQPRHVRLGSCW